MKPSRNDPCPCGSGKKYKACCQARERARAQTRRLMGAAEFDAAEAEWQGAARQAPFWEADVVPVFGGLRDDPDSALALVMVAAAGYIPYSDVLSQRPGSAEERARQVARGVMGAGRELGLLPERLHVRDEALAAALGAELAPRGIEVRVAPLPGLDEALTSTIEHFGAPGTAILARPHTWRETEAPAADLAELHAAAAAFYRAEPWAYFGEMPLLLAYPGGETWAACTMGSAGMEYGIAMYADPEELEMLLESDPDAPPGELLDRQVHPGLTVDFNPRHELSPAMRREVSSAGWQVAAEEAYPLLTGMRLAERRVTAHHVRLAAGALRAVAAAADAGADGRWTDPATGITVGMPDPGPLFGDDDEEEYGPLPWPPFTRARPICAEGPRANPHAALDYLAEPSPALVLAEEERLQRYRGWLDGQKLSKAARERRLRTAREWTELLAVDERIPAGAATEYDLRYFIYHWLPGGAPLTVLRDVPACVRSLCGWLEAHEGIRYPFAEAVVAELEQMVRDDGGPMDSLLISWAPRLMKDLDGRLLLPRAEVADGDLDWPPIQIPDVAVLRRELRRRVLLWHDEAVRAGTTDPADLGAELRRRQTEWETAPHPVAGGQTPEDRVRENLRELEETFAHMVRQGLRLPRPA
ncbi:MAG TPA: SEC-C domain-containing protein [Longimicrobium sp.]|nr:SEC-C domain-containing protein [Longimicrobium sp.]